MATVNDRTREVEITTRGEGLARDLRKHHITGIGISGTIGAGLFITSGEIIGLAGSLGAVLSYLIAGIMVICVMLCISEMLSVRPVAGAFFEFPKIYVDPALAFATGWAYWLAYTCSCCTLIVQAAMILDYWNVSIPLGILACWAPVVCFNFFGPVLWYGNLEWGFKWLKLLLVAGLSVLMIAIAAGVRGTGSVSIESPSANWNRTTIFPPGLCFEGWFMNCQNQGPDITGPVGAFLGVWTGITSAVFAFIGVEIVIITAGEAKYPRHDLPIATRWIYLFAVFIYVLLTALASLNVAYNDPALLPFGAKGTIDVPEETLALFPYANNGNITTGDRSPFVIAVKRAGFISGLPGFINGCLFFATLTAANTAFYVSSRTLYALSSTTSDRRLRETLGRTSYGHLPLNAIAVTIILSICSWIGSIKGLQNELVGAVSRISVTSIICVYISECVAFIRYQIFVKRSTHMDRDYRNVEGQRNWYRSPGHQPLPAIWAIVFGAVLITFNGWDTFFRAYHRQLSSGAIAAGILRSYLGPVVFLVLFFSYKKIYRTNLVNYHQFYNQYNPGDNDLALDATPLVYSKGWRQALAEMK